jgi:hypothetical protein
LIGQIFVTVLVERGGFNIEADRNVKELLFFVVSTQTGFIDRQVKDGYYFFG